MNFHAFVGVFNWWKTAPLDKKLAGIYKTGQVITEECQQKQVLILIVNSPLQLLDIFL